MKNFKTILIVTLILDVIQVIPLLIAKAGSAMKDQMISDFNIDGLAESAPALEVMDIILHIFGYVFLGLKIAKKVFSPLCNDIKNEIDYCLVCVNFSELVL